MDETIALTAHAGCSGAAEVIGRLGDKWTVLVVMSLHERPRRFNDLKRRIGGVSQQMLTRTLKALERDGMVSRTVRPTVPPQVEYALTDLGRSLAEPVRALGDWAFGNIAAIHAQREVYDRAADPR
ncbi:MAG: helix-turn-helix domain-containing protein [Pseudomonadota bacterium]